MTKIKYLRPGVIFLIPLIFIFSHCFDNSVPADPRGSAYAGSVSCVKCHKEQYLDYMHNAHYLTSRTASQANIHGSFNNGSNTVIINDSVKVIMEKHKDGLYQASYIHGKLKEKERFDIVFGSNRGETYLYWKGKEIYELPATYYLNLHQWANSPGYKGDNVDFNRIMGKRCFECHASNAQTTPQGTALTGQSELFDKNSMILSIDCERCHGPAAKHVTFHLQNPEEKKPMYITKLNLLSRSQRIDLCSTCHSGNKDFMVKSIFDFKPGDTLAKFKMGSYVQVTKDLTNTDVHGNQAELLTSSKCFIKGKIECAVCHNIHDDQVKTVSMYSQRCITCHSQAKHNFCKMEDKLGNAINNHCIDCHMPIRSSNVIVINGAGKPSTPAYQARLHRIAIYPEESNKIIAWIKGH